MKIAILSMQRVVNFGSVLQAYALRGLVEETAGVSADFLDIEDLPSLPSAQSVKEAEDYTAPAALSGKILQRAKRWTIVRLSALNKRLIRSFMQRELRLDEENSKKKYSHALVGSDEVFNHADGKVRLQLHGAVKQAEKLIAYAASCGSASAGDLRREDLPVLRVTMSRFSAMSVRDEATQAYVSALYDGEIARHLDPVLVGGLHARRHKRVLLKNYMLVYAYGQRIRTEEEIDAIRAFAKARGLKIVAVGGSQFWCDLYIPLTPFRLLDYFHAAEYVVTDTFHGAVFSIINHRKFAAIVRKSNQGKLSSLLSDLGLEARRVGKMSDLETVLSAEIDYASVDAILNRERIRTREYLREQLKG